MCERILEGQRESHIKSSVLQISWKFELKSLMGDLCVCGAVRCVSKKDANEI